MKADANGYRWSGRILLAGVVSAALAALTPARAQDDPIRGIVLGPLILGPIVEVDFEYDSNVLNAPPSFGQDTGDSSTSLGAGIEALLPFSNNWLEFRYRGANVEYENSEFASGLRQEGDLALELEFRTGVTVGIRDRFRRDFAQILDSSISDQGPGFEPEQKYFGSPYIFNRFDVDVERDQPHRIGYRVRIGRRDFDYEEGTVGTQFEFQGFDNLFEYYQPLSSNRRLVVHYSMRRMNNFRDGEGLFRKEVSDSIEAGLSGVGGVRPFFFRVGYSRFVYEYPEGSQADEGENYRGLSGYARWLLPFGGRSSLALSLSRRPLPSSFDTFYISDQFRGIAERAFRPRVTVALIFGVRKNRYADEIPQLNCDGAIRDDIWWDAGFRASWDVHHLIELGLAGTHEQRISNCENVGFVSTSANLGMRFGWF